MIIIYTSILYHPLLQFLGVYIKVTEYAERDKCI